jgi:hypothetical protein
MKEFVQRHFQSLKASNNHLLRKAVGLLLVIGGVLGFLPVLGYWMLPLGLALLAVDWPVARRAYRRMVVAWGRLRQWWRERFSRSATEAVYHRRSRRSRDRRSGP